MGYREDYFAAEADARDALTKELEALAAERAANIEKIEAAYTSQRDVLIADAEKAAAERFVQMQYASSKEAAALIAESNATVGLDPSGNPIKSGNGKGKPAGK